MWDRAVLIETARRGSFKASSLIATVSIIREPNGSVFCRPSRAEVSPVFALKPDLRYVSRYANAWARRECVVRWFFFFFPSPFWELQRHIIVIINCSRGGPEFDTKPIAVTYIKI